MYLQADKPLFHLPLVYIIPPEELSAPAAEHETAPESPIIKEKKKEVTEASGPPLSVFHHLFPNLFISPLV
jgi:hypothetical protein